VKRFPWLGALVFWKQSQRPLPECPPVDFRGCLWISPACLAQASLRKPRRPVAEQMLSIRGRDVRSLVEVNQQTVRLPQRGDSLSLLWRWRSGGCLGA
jgi:hypothetical protein